MPSGGTRQGAGPKEKDIELKVLEALRRVGCTQEEISAHFGMTERAFEKRKAKSKEIQQIMESAAARGRSSLRRQLHMRAQAGSDACLIFLAKNELGMTDRIRQEMTGKNGGAIELNTNDVRSRIASKLSSLAAKQGTGEAS